MENTVKSLKKNIEKWQDINAEPYIQVQDVTKSYGELVTLKEISLSVYKGELFSLLGRSGCGKTTLLRILAGFEKPTSGKVLIDGIDMTNWPAYKRPVNMMFQSYALFPHMTVAQNIAFGLKQDGLSKHVIDERVKESLALVQLSGYEERKPDRLSGGQRQRVALARSLAKRPKLLLLDEPMAALDKKLREQTQFELVNIQEKVGITFIVVTHDQEEAMTMSTRMAIMDEGKIRQVGVPHDVYEFPNSKYVAEFIGTVNLFEGVVAEQELDHVLVESQEIDCPCYAAHTGALPVGSKVTLAIRPEKIMVSTMKPAYPRNWTIGVIKEIAYLGDISIYYVQLESGKMVRATLPNLLRLSERNFTWEDKVYLFWRAENSVVLTA
ncbi:MAG: polyamine ABC transporter ATP-binding protein [Alphaproteobacteria bacterium]|nr:polyamine ABC transporter ATP-binding protein [Alphaproteobacteria bacterium]